MLITTQRSRLASLAGQAILLTRAFATSSIHHKRTTLMDAFENGLNCGKTPELVTAHGLRNLAKHSSSAAEDRLKHASSRVTASLQHADAHNCTLSLTVANMANLPVFKNDSWKEQAHAAMDIIEHEQSLALTRAGVSVSQNVGLRRSDHTSPQEPSLPIPDYPTDQFNAGLLAHPRHACAPKRPQQSGHRVPPAGQ